MPKTNAESARQLARNSADCSFLLTHLIRQNDGRTDSDSKSILASILDLAAMSPSPVLQASPVGWYSSANCRVYNAVTGSFDDDSNPEAVCFTESTLAGLRAHRDLFQVKYGLAFDRDWLFQRGANPCLNIAEPLLKSEFYRQGEARPRHIYNFIPPRLHPFVNIIHDSFDATHEREWRFAGDMGFAWEDVRFIFCPERDFPIFAKAQSDGLPCLFDLGWLDRV